jgi:hypothetical protein
MLKKPAKRLHLRRKGNALSIHGPSVEEALAAALRVNPADVKKMEEQEAKAKRKGK